MFGEYVDGKGLVFRMSDLDDLAGALLTLAARTENKKAPWRRGGIEDD